MHVPQWISTFMFSVTYRGQSPDGTQGTGELTSSLWTLHTAAAKSLQSCPTLCDPIDGSPPGSPSLGFSRQEYWSGLPFPSPIYALVYCIGVFLSDLFHSV